MANNSEILQVIQHSLILDDIIILDRESEGNIESSMSPAPSKVIGTLFPYVEINNYEFSFIDIISAELSVVDFLPTIRLKLKDGDGLFQSRQFALDGAILNFYIRANNEEVFKPIHINFDIIEISPSSKVGNKQTFIVNGQMKIPNLYTEYCKSYPEMTSYDVLSSIAETLKLGFATNETELNDIMTWINPYDTNYKFIKDITKNSYKDENSFFTTYIDPYYNLTFVNINKVFDNIKVIPSEIYSISPQDMNINEYKYDIIPLVFTNHSGFSGTSKYIVNYKFGNNSAEIFLKNGYKRGLQYYDSLENQYINNVEIQGLTGTNTGIHLKGRYINGQSEGLKDEYIKYKYLGKQNENVHDYYMYSNMFNYQNLEESKKIYMIIEIRGTDMSIYKYMSVMVQIFEYSMEYRELAKAKSENQDDISIDESVGIYNEFLSGMYIITGIDYIYSTPGPIRQKIYLSKRNFVASI